MSYMSSEIAVPVDLCLNDGMLNPDAVGWSRHPLHRCNLSGHWPRKKRWDYWCVMTPSFAFSVTLASLDSFGFANVYLLDFETNRCFDATHVMPFARGMRFGEHVGEPIRFARRGTVITIEDDGDNVRLDVDWPGFAREGLEAGIDVRRLPGHETLNVVVPWNAHQFQFTSKQNALPASGHIVLGSRSYGVSGPEAFAVLDFGRGIWPYRTTWNWATCAARCGTDLVGLNLGGQWTDGTGATENGICRNGRLAKIQEPVRFEYDRRNFMTPWRIRTLESDAVDLAFSPFYDRGLGANLLVIKSKVHQMFGRFEGSVRMDGERVAIKHGLGWAEEFLARW
jgi:hypothetical protein